MSNVEYQQEWRRLHPGYQQAYYAANKERIKARAAKWRAENPEKVAAYRKTRDTASDNTRWRKAHPAYPHTANHKAWRRQLREDVLAAYGGHCQCCGESEPVFLDVDHIDGATPEGERKLRSSPLYRWLRKNDYPSGYRVLCRNCNWGVHVYLECPHKGVLPHG